MAYSWIDAKLKANLDGAITRSPQYRAENFNYLSLHQHGSGDHRTQSMAALLKRSNVEWGEGVREAAERKVQAQRDAQQSASSSSSSTRYPPSCPPSRGAASSHSQAPPPQSSRPCLGRDIREDPNFRPSTTSSSSSSSRPVQQTSTSTRPYSTSSRSTPYQSYSSREYQSYSGTRSTSSSSHQQQSRSQTWDGRSRNEWRNQRQDRQSGDVWLKDRYGNWYRDHRN